MNTIKILLPLYIILFHLNETIAQEKVISIQGFLKDARGIAVDDGKYAATFRIYDDEADGSLLWQNTDSIDVFGGLYQTSISNGVNPSNSESPYYIDTLSWTEPYYLSIEINNTGDELEPRVSLSYSPLAYAVNFANVAGIADTVRCSGAVGDVKYSFLSPTEFSKANGACWVPMDGETSLVGTKLKSLLDEMNNGSIGSFVPDVSGLFLRSHEFSTSSNDYDADRMPSSLIASHQTGANKKHSHTMQSAGSHSHSLSVTTRGSQNADGDGGAGFPKDEVGSEQPAGTDSQGSHTHTINNAGGVELRPKNMSFYVYIRVD